MIRPSSPLTMLLSRHTRRLRASGRDEGRVMIRPSSPLTMLLSRHTRRREFITLLGGAAAWPLAANGQQPVVRLPRIGIIDDEPVWDHFRQGLRDLGYVERENVLIEYRSAGGRLDRLTQAALELASVPVNVIVAYGSPATRAVRQATSTVPIVMIAIGDPVRAGFATNLARPDRNITGNTILGPDLIGKRLEVLKDCVPDLTRVAFLWNPDNDSNL